MAQGARVSSNLLYDNLAPDLFFEVSHGPYVVDNNIALSPYSVRENTDGGAYVHNLFAGDITRLDDSRYTPYHLNHSTEVKGFRTFTEGDHRFYNNIFIGRNNEKHKYGLVMFDASKWPIYAEGNLFCNGAKPMTGKQQGPIVDEPLPSFYVEETGDAVYLNIGADIRELANFRCQPVDAARLGVTKLSGYRFENPQGEPVDLGKDYWGMKRSSASPIVGPVEDLSSGSRIKVWGEK